MSTPTPEALARAISTADKDLCSVLTFVHHGMRVALVAAPTAEGRARVTADIFCPGHQPHTEWWTVGGLTLQDAVLRGGARAMARIDELHAGSALAAA